jgi:transposase-like protein
MAKKKSVRRKRYSPEQKKNILETAAKDGLTGAQVAKRFGVAQLTFYRWRGPVRGPKAKAAMASKQSGKVKIDEHAIRQAVRAGVARVLPQIIREEVAQALAEMTGRRRPGRPRAA